jgi:hypothetical protein
MCGTPYAYFGINVVLTGGMLGFIVKPLNNFELEMLTPSLKASPNCIIIANFISTENSSCYEFDALNPGQKIFGVWTFGAVGYDSANDYNRTANVSVTITPAALNSSTTIPMTTSTTSITTTTTINMIRSTNATLYKVYVGGNLTSGSFTVQLEDLGAANSNGVSPAEVVLYYNGKLNTTAAILPQSTTAFKINGQTLYVTVNQTYAAYFAYQKWATILLSFSPPVTTTTSIPATTSSIATTTTINATATTSTLSKVPVGGNLTSGSFTVQLQNLGVANSNGISPAAIAIYYNGTPTQNVTSILPPSTVKFKINGKTLYVTVNQTYSGYYAYQKWAMMALYVSPSTTITTTSITTINTSSIASTTITQASVTSIISQIVSSIIEFLRRL